MAMYLPTSTAGYFVYGNTINENILKTTTDSPITYVVIWANYSVSSYLYFIPICWNVLIWLKYDFMHIYLCIIFPDMKFSISSLVLTLDPYQPSRFAVGLDMGVSG
jgi:hypothetical protein